MLKVAGLHKTYSSGDRVVPAVNNVSFDVHKGQFFTLLGPSGCGKSTTLRCVAGLEVPDQGEIHIADSAVCVMNKKTRVFVPPHKRGVGMVFQSYAVWPHLTVFQNVALALKHGANKIARQQISERVKHALELVGLGGLQDRPAPFLSGGQQQRVALARALVYEPRLLLLDEPLSNLDAKLRVEIRSELRELIDRLGITALYVTHDQEEALALSDRIVVMDAGRIVEEGNPRDIYIRPNHVLTATSIGEINRIEGEALSAGNHTRELLVSTPLGEVSCGGLEGVKARERLVLLFRPEDVRISEENAEPQGNRWTGTIQRVVFLGKRLVCYVQVEKQLLHCETAPQLKLEKGQHVCVEIPSERIRIFRA
jgi:iron(III) transport system ATP-binding protein